MRAPPTDQPLATDNFLDPSRPSPDPFDKGQAIFEEKNNITIISLNQHFCALSQEVRD